MLIFNVIRVFGREVGSLSDLHVNAKFVSSNLLQKLPALGSNSDVNNLKHTLGKAFSGFERYSLASKSYGT